MKPLAIDLFCGLGGWTDGLLAEGWRVIGFDIEQHVYGDQRYPAQLVVQDVLTLHGSQFKDADLIVASPPCQEFSYMAMPWRRAKQIARALRATESAAADAQGALPIRPMSVPGRADTGSSGGRESGVLGRAGISKHGQPRQPGAHGPDGGGNPAKSGAPTERVEGPQFPDGYRGSRTKAELTALFDACFRIQREASEAAGRRIPLIVENVRGAMAWVGRARWNYGSFYLWGDVPALMPMTLSARKNPGFRFDGSGRSFQTESVERHRKNNGGSWFNIGSPGQKVTGKNPVHDIASGRKGKGAGAAWFDGNLCVHGSKSPARKAASAMIAKIPLPLSQHIAATFKPMRKAA